MVQVHIHSGLEVFEIINAFPILSKVFEDLHLNLDSIVEGVSLEDFLRSKHLKEDEIVHVVNKLNYEIDLFLKGNSKYTKSSSEGKHSLKSELVV
jgi:hypothetical protein